MGQTRDWRKRVDRREAAATELRRRVKALFAKLQLLALFERVPAELRDQLYACCWPDPQLVFDPSFPSAEAFGGAYAAVRARVCEAFPKATVTLNGFDLSVRDYWGIVLPMAAVLRNTLRQFDSPLYGGPRPSPATRAFFERAAPVMAYAAREEVREETYSALHAAVISPLVSRGRLDTRLLRAELSHVRLGDRGARLVMTCYSEQPAVKYVRLRDAKSGGTRPMHRVGTANAWNGIEWASWARDVLKGHWAAEIGIPPGAEWPVYAQSHALKQLRARLDVYAHADWAEHWMVESLRKPKIVSRLPGEELLVAFEVQGQRLGYLVVTARDGLVAVRTFLFLTMAQTPEGRLLRQRLKLTPDEVQYFRLNELSRFTQTDLKDDPALRGLLEECGCGQLFELADDEDAMLPAVLRGGTPFADELKQYIGLAA